MDSSSSIQEERAARIAELESRLSAPPRRGIRPITAVVGMFVSLLLLWMMRHDLQYFVSPTSPIVLGREGAYELEKLESNRYVEIRGVPTLRGAYEKDGDDTFVTVGLQGTPVLVRRGALPGEEWTVGQTPPQPDQRPFAVRGRLLSEWEAGRFQDAFRRLRDMGEVGPRNGQLWLVLESQRPGQDWGTMLAAGGLVSFLLLNVWLLRRRYRRRPSRS